MNNVRSRLGRDILFSLLILSPQILLSAPRVEVQLTEEELVEVINNATTDYVNLDEKSNELSDVIELLSRFDKNDNSLLSGLKDHINHGYAIGEYGAVVQALEYAETLLHDNYNNLDKKTAKNITKKLTSIIDCVINKDLIVNAKTISFTTSPLKDKKDPCHDSSDTIVFNEDIECKKNLIVKKKTRLHEYIKAYGKARFKDDVIFEEDVKFEDEVKFEDKVEFDDHVKFKEDVKFEDEVEFEDDVKFKEDVKFEDEVEFEDKVKFEDSVKFEKNVKIKGNLVVKETTSLNDAIIENLSVNEAFAQDLSVIDLSATNATIDNLTVNNCIDNLCIINLSVVDATVSGTLSVNDAIIGDATITTLSVTDEVVQNLTVINCMDDLCVIDFSALDASINHLSAMDAIIDMATINILSATDIVIPSIEIGCDLTVGCNISMVDSTDSGHGNIIKDGARWIHNYPGSGTGNVYMGLNAGNFTGIGAQNVGIGWNSLISNITGNQNSALGGFTLTSNDIGSRNTALGYQTLGSNTNGNENTAVGGFALTSNTTGLGNTGLGFNSGMNLDGGDNNVLVGNRAGINLATGSSNIMMGYNAGLNLVTGTSNIYIGNAGTNPESGIIRIGTPATHTKAFVQGIFGATVGGTGIPVNVDAAGQLGTVVSSAVFKTRINKVKQGDSERIYDLEPVTFVYKEDASQTKQYGFIAEQVAQVLPELVVNDAEGKPFTVRYQLLPILLLNEIQRLNYIAQEQEISIDALKKDNQRLGEMLHTILDRLGDA